MRFWGPMLRRRNHLCMAFAAGWTSATTWLRSATDGRFVYLRNYMPHKLPGQHVNYMFQTPTTQVWQQLHEAGKLTAAQEIFWKPKPAEELYDLTNDPDEIDNLAGLPEHQQTLVRLRNPQQNLARTIRDVGFLPEGEIHARSARTTPYDMAHDEAKYPLDRIMQAAELASRVTATRCRRWPKHYATRIAPRGMGAL